MLDINKIDSSWTLFLDRDGSLQGQGECLIPAVVSLSAASDNVGVEAVIGLGG